MEIIGINSKLSSPDKVALNLSPSLTPEMFAQIKKISVGPLLSSLSFENINGCLIFRCVGGLDEHISHNIKVMLKAATENFNEIQKIKQEQAETQANLEKSMKNSGMKTAAELFKVPVQ